MKNKVLLSTLLGSALLVGCTADDALDVEKVAEKVNPAAPVFTISLEDDLTRATYEDGVMKWQKGDKMSLFHGGGEVNKETGLATSTKNGNDNFLASGQVRNFDAIYTNSVNDAGQPTFTTAAMVTQGLAIMVYPADTNYIQKDVNPHLYLETEQTKATRLKTPYISEVLNITPHGDLKPGQNEHSAGYDRNYFIELRRIGGALNLSLAKENEDLISENVPGIEIDKVTMEVDGGDADLYPFTKDIVLQVGQKRRKSTSDATTGLVGKNTSAKYDYWEYSPWIRVSKEPGAKVNMISTEDITEAGRGETPVASFTFLPIDDETDVIKVVKDEETKEIKEIIPGYGNVKVTVETNYGKVEIAANETRKLWQRARYPEETVNQGLASTLQSMFDPQPEGSGLFSGQLLARNCNRTLTVDLKKLNMDGLHVKDEEQLMNVLKVYDDLKPTGAVTLILDGEAEGADKERFVMHKETWEAVVKQLNKSGNQMSFEICESLHKCTAVKLVNDKNEEIDVPALRFGSETTVELACEGTSTWKYNNAALNVDKISELIVLKNAALNLYGTVGVKAGQILKKIVVNKDGKVEVKNLVTLNVNMDNSGEITIPAGGKELAVGANVTLENCAAAMESGVNGWTEGGVIYNSGWLSIVEQSNTANKGEINNYGVIEAMTADARTLITRNLSTGANYRAPFNSTTGNKVGTIILHDKDAGGNNTKISVGDAQGFIKLILDDETIDEINDDVIGAVANFIVVKKAHSIAHLPTKVMYVEIQTGHEVVFNEGVEFTLRGIAIPYIDGKNNSINIPLNASVKISHYIHLKGRILKAGGLDYTGAVFNGYFGGEANDVTNIRVY